MVVSGFVVVAGLLGMLSSLLTSLQERRREMAILRAMGARPRHIFSLLILEASVLTFVGILVGITMLYGILALVGPFVTQNYGIQLPLVMLSNHEFALIAAVQFAGTVIGIFPALRAYRQSLSDGMTIRV